MVTLGEKSYSGYVVETGDEVDVIIHSVDSLEDITDGITEITTITQTNSGEKTQFFVKSYLGAKEISQYIHALKFGTGDTIWDEYEAIIQEQSNMIDSLIILALGEE